MPGDDSPEVVVEIDGSEPLPPGSWRILLPVNDSPEAHRATLAAAALAKRGGGVVEVLHVRVVNGNPLVAAAPETWAEATALVGRALGELRDRDVTARGQLRTASASKVVQNIVSEAEQIRANLIVMGSTTGSWLAAVNGSRVAGGVIKKARCPVLVTP
jgi:nucleotide-binding universal stress UspA family protein